MTASLGHLIEAGLIEFTVPLTWYRPDRGVTHRAELLPSGLIRHRDRTYGTPSAATEAVSGQQANGWTAWRVPDGRTLADLRALLETET